MQIAINSYTRKISHRIGEISIIKSTKKYTEIFYYEKTYYFIFNNNSARCNYGFGFRLLA